MEHQLQPRAGGSLAVKILLATVAVCGALALFLPMFRGEVTLEGLLEAAGVLLIVALPAAILLLEGRRARSVVLSPSGISSLVWATRPSFPFLTLARVDVPWADVDGVGRRGLIVGLKSGGRKLLVNTYLFPDPARTGEFIEEQLKRVHGSRDAL